MTLPKGFGGGGGGASRADVEGMIGKRIENYTSLITLSYLGAFFATMFWNNGWLPVLSMGICISKWSLCNDCFDSR